MSDPTTHALPPAATMAAVSSEAAARKGRRRLWNLPTQAHELLLATGFMPKALRREAARMLGRVHRGVCILGGSDTDVLYSLVHDMTTRNPLSESFHKRLDERYALAVRRMASLCDAEALQAAWVQALSGDEMPASLWALLTHPLGVGLQGAALYDARGWVFAHCRRSVNLMQAQALARDGMQEARRQVEELRARLSVQQQQASAALAAARTEHARLVGELARLQGAVRDSGNSAADTRPPATDRRALSPPLSRPKAVVAVPTQDIEFQPVLTVLASQAETPSQPLIVEGRRVLCVGGIQHAVARYRSRIERLGGHFEHHDGGLEDSAQSLDGRLRRAEIVICQAGCINHEAYHRVKRHCERTGTPCVYLDRPSLSRLDRALNTP